MSIANPRQFRDSLQYLPSIARRSKIFAAIFILAVAGSGMSGCRMDDHMALMLDDPEQRHAIAFDRSRETLIIEAPERGMALSNDQVVGLHSFLRHYKNEAGGHLVVTSPRRGGARHAVKPILTRMHRILRDVDIDLTRITIRHHHSRRNWPTVTLSYHRPVAVGPACGDWSEDVGVNRERIHYPNYGCASQRNLAATVDNARDLIRPRDVTQRSSERRGSQWKDYVQSGGGELSEEATTKSTSQGDN